MDIPDSVLLNLKCENCECYLSCGPVLMLDEERSRCGRCPIPLGGAKRMKPYEELAKLMKFPCRYKENGCQEKIRFKENKEHEENCTFKMLCPIVQLGICDWSGVRSGILDHCKLKHHDNVIKTKFSLGNYVLFAFRMLFLVQTNVSTETKKLYHSVRLFGDPKLATKYKYDLNIAKKITIHGDVAPEGPLPLQADTSNELDISGLLAEFKDSKDNIFNLTVRSTDGEAEKRAEKTKRKNSIDIPTTSKKSKIQVPCSDCSSMTDLVHQRWQGNSQKYKEGWLCSACAPRKRPCKNKAKGCKYNDSERKCRKHERFYCPHGTYCELCKMNLTSVSLNKHYVQAHSDITYRSGTECYKGKLSYHKKMIIKCNFGNLICTHSRGDLLISSPIPTEELYKYKCVVEVNDLQTGEKDNCTVNARYDLVEDWRLNMEEEFPEIYSSNSYCTYTIDFIEN